jgi:hypothetical protein
LWSIDNHIQKDENILFIGNPAWIGYIWGFVFALITIPTIIIPIIILVIIYLHRTSTIYAITNKRVVGRTGFILSEYPAALLRLGQTTINVTSVVTPSQEMPRSSAAVGSFTSEDFKSSTFKHITSLRVKQGIIGKLFNFGNIIVDTSGSGLGVEFIWRYVNNPVNVKNEIEKHIE